MVNNFQVEEYESTICQNNITYRLIDVWQWPRYIKYSLVAQRQSSWLLINWSVVRSHAGEPNLALLSLMAEVLFCKQGVRVRFLQGAPSYCGEGGHHTGLISQVHRQFESVPRIHLMSMRHSLWMSVYSVIWKVSGQFSLPPWLNWIEHWITNPGVGSSNLSGGTTFWLRNSEAEYSLDKREVDISKLSAATKIQLTTTAKGCIINT